MEDHYPYTMLKVSGSESSIYHKDNLIFLQHLREDSVTRTWKENWPLLLTPCLWVALYKVFHTSVGYNDITSNYLLGSLDEMKIKRYNYYFMITNNKQHLCFVSLLPTLSFLTLNKVYSACFLHFLSPVFHVHTSISLWMEGVYSLV